MKTMWLIRMKKDTTFESNGDRVKLDSLAFLLFGVLSVKLRRKLEKKAEGTPEVRLVITAILDAEGKELAKWFLLSNVEEMDV